MFVIGYVAHQYKKCIVKSAERQINWIVCQIYLIKLLLRRKQILDQDSWAAFPSKRKQLDNFTVWVS